MHASPERWALYKSQCGNTVLGALHLTWTWELSWGVLSWQVESPWVPARFRNTFPWLLSCFHWGFTDHWLVLVWSRKSTPSSEVGGHSPGWRHSACLVSLCSNSLLSQLWPWPWDHSWQEILCPRYFLGSPLDCDSNNSGGTGQIRLAIVTWCRDRPEGVEKNHICSFFKMFIFYSWLRKFHSSLELFRFMFANI